MLPRELFLWPVIPSEREASFLGERDSRDLAFLLQTLGPNPGRPVLIPEWLSEVQSFLIWNLCHADL